MVSFFSRALCLPSLGASGSLWGASRSLLGASGGFWALWGLGSGGFSGACGGLWGLWGCGASGAWKTRILSLKVPETFYLPMERSKTRRNLWFQLQTDATNLVREALATSKVKRQHYEVKCSFG